MNIVEYRKITKDNITSDEKVLEHIQVLTGLCENIIDTELIKYLNEGIKSNL